jgi:hypothetical protein
VNDTHHPPRHGLVAVGADHPCLADVLANFVSLEMSPVLKETGFVLFLSFPFEFILLLVDPFAEEISKPVRHHDKRCR